MIRRAIGEFLDLPILLVGPGLEKSSGNACALQIIMCISAYWAFLLNDALESCYMITNYFL